MLTADRPYYDPLPEMDSERVLRSVDEELLLPSAHRVRPGAALVFVSGTGARHPGIGLSVIAAVTMALQAEVAKLAHEFAPIRINLGVAAGFVDTPLSAAILGDELEARLLQLRATLPIGRVAQAADVAALAVYLMTNTALTGAIYDVDGDQQIATEAWA
jgi:NAD(P)-dependent dehydrogenase (short-subunit alcohol dehydrogenase family)